MYWSVSTGEDALQFLDGRTIDIIITDLHMPNLDGLGLIRKVREIECLQAYSDFVPYN